VDKDQWFTLVLQDMMSIGGESGNNVEGCTIEQAGLALSNLAKLQAPVLDSKLIEEDAFLNEPTSLTQAFYQENLPALLSRYPPSEEHAEFIKWFGENLTAWETDNQPPFAIFHGDYRLDNLIFVPDEARCVAVDWGGLSRANAMRDAAYFIGNGLTREQRLQHEDKLVRDYVKELSRLSGQELDWDHCWNEYRRQVRPPF
jgi:thiamine kinase-like enzyme